MAAYYDADYKSKEWRLPAKGGSGGVYLASFTPDTLIVPVAVDIKSKEAFAMGDSGIAKILKEMRPEVDVILGEPYTPAKIDNIDKFGDILRKRKQNIPTTDEERTIFTNVHTALRQESNRLMEKLAELLPANKLSDAALATRKLKQSEKH